MTTEIVLTLDFFLRDWNDPTPENAQLWVCVQPHVIEGQGGATFDSLIDWVDNSATGAKFDYRLTSPTSAGNPIPIDFCDDVNVSLNVVRGANVARITSDRRKGVRVRDAAAAEDIALVNREPEDERTKANAMPGQSPVAPIEVGPFAAGYNRTLRAARAAGRLTPDELSQMLKLAFWGGTRRYVPTSAIERGDVALMQLPESDASLIVTNLHSLCGLMLLVGTRNDIANLRNIEDLQIVLDDGATVFPVQDQDANAKRSIKAFFSKLPGTISLTDPPSATWDPNVANRVYAIDNFAALTHVPLPGAWYRRQSEAPASAQHRLLSNLHRAVVRFDTQRPTAEPVPNWPRLQWQAWDAFDVTITPYRRFAASRAANGEGPLHLQLAPSDRERFYAELADDPQLLSRADVRLIDSEGNDHRLTFLGAYDFPWDRAAGELLPAACATNDAPTVVLHGPIATPQALTLLVPRAAVLETTRSGDEDSFGPRWELTRVDPLPEVHFTHLQCIDLPDATKAARLSPAIAFERDLRFEFAQSASSIEGTLTAEFPHAGTPVTDPDDVDPVDEFVHDLVNHNAVNVYAKWAGRPLEVDAGKRPGRKEGHLNPYGEIYPAVSENGNGKVVYEVPFRHRLAPAAPPPDASQQGVRLYFRDMYARIGANRELAFDFEHTYGTQLALPIGGGSASVSGLSSHYDFDLVTPPEVTRTGEPGAGCPATAATDFLTVTYHHAAQREILRFTLNTQWLLSDYAVCGNRSMRETHIAAWRAVAELAYASEVRVTGLFRRFDFHAAVRSCDIDGLAAGLTPVPAFEDRVWIVPAEKLSTKCRELLENGASTSVHEFEIVLTDSMDSPKVFESCNVIEIFLRASRDAARLASVRPWTFVKPKPQQRQDSTLFQPLTARKDLDDAKEIFTSYLTSIAAKQSVVKPSFDNAQQAAEAARFRRLLGNGVGRVNDAVSRPEADPGAWILPEGVAVATSGTVVASVCPLTFRSPALHPLLGPLTFDLVRNYFRLLQAVIDCDFHGATNLSDAEWRAHFVLLDQAARALENADSLFDAVLDSVIAVPNDDPAAGIEPEVRALAERLRDPSSEAAVAFRRWLAHRLWREPSMFADAKALLFHRLRPSSGTVVPPELFAFDSTRRISAGLAEEPSHATFRQSLVDLHETAWFGFGEVLDDIRYDNDFTFTGYRLQSFEGVVSEIPDPRHVVPIDGPLHLPADTQSPDEPGTVIVHLASRAPVVPPAHLFSGAMDVMQRRDVLAQLRNQRLSLEMLKRGKLVPAAAGELAVTLAGATADLAASPRLDQFVLSTMFSVYGDEETANNWRSAFDNDEWRIHLRRRSNDAVAFAAATAASRDIAQLFSSIAETSHMQQAKVAPKLVVAPEALAFVAGILRTKTGAPPVEAAPSLKIQHREGAGDCTALTLQFPIADPLAGRVQAFLFAESPENLASPCDEAVSRKTFILMVNVLTGVWDRSAVGLVQMRNARDGFAPDLAQVTQTVFPDRFHQPFFTAQGPALTIPRRAHKVEELVAAFGFAEADAWRAHDVSVTISHLQRREFPAALNPGQETAIDQESAFPLAVARQDHNAADPTFVEFDAEYDDFVLDLQWSSETNLQFFRVNECRIRLV